MKVNKVLCIGYVLTMNVCGVGCGRYHLLLNNFVFYYSCVTDSDRAPKLIPNWQGGWQDFDGARSHFYFVRCSTKKSDLMGRGGRQKKKKNRKSTTTQLFLSHLTHNIYFEISTVIKKKGNTTQQIIIHKIPIYTIYLFL